MLPGKCKKVAHILKIYPGTLQVIWFGKFHDMKKSIILSQKYLPLKSTIFMMVGAFICYTGMYVVRKSFLAGQYLNMGFYGMDFKTILVVSQVLGYMFSKFVGIKLVSEMTSTRREIFLVVLVGFGLLMLLAFAILPLNLKPYALILTGYHLGWFLDWFFPIWRGKKNRASCCSPKCNIYFFHRIHQNRRNMAYARFWCR